MLKLSDGGGIRASRRLAAGLAVVVALLFAGAVAATLRLAATYDDLGRDAAERMIRGGLADERADIQRTAEDYALWTAAYDAVRARDREWISDNIGSGIFEGGIADLMVVVLGDDEPPYGWTQDGAGAPETGLLDDAALAALDAAIAATPSESTEAQSIFARSGGALWALAAIRFAATEGARDEALAAHPPRLIVGRKITPELMSAVGERFLIDDLTLADAPVAGRDSLAVTGPGGEPLGYAVWTAPGEGRRILLNMAPLLIVAFLILAVAAGLVGRRLLTVAQRLENAVAAERQARREKDEFLATVSHELRTPMGGVIGLTQLLLARHGDAPTQKLLNALLSTAKSQVQLVSDLLELARLDGGERALVDAPFDPARVLSEVGAIAAFDAAEKGVRLTVTGLAPGALNVAGDELAFRQICVNLIGNAIKFTEEGEVAAELTGGATARVAELRFTVRDQGPGVPEDQRARIFERFAQAEMARDRAKGGHGLGLAVVKSLVDAMEGMISVDEAPGGGALFVVELRLPLGPQEAMRAA